MRTIKYCIIIIWIIKIHIKNKKFNVEDIELTQHEKYKLVLGIYKKLI